jgi:dienelactone hydrolase
MSFFKMAESYQHLGIFSNWVTAAQNKQMLYPLASPGRDLQNRVKEALGFCHGPEVPLNVKIEQRWEKDNLSGEEVSWWVGYGPRTHAYVLKPQGTVGPLPGIVALHDHGGFKFYGKEKIADGPSERLPVLIRHQEAYYEKRAYANALAKEGFVVLVHDTFLWGSRRFPLEEMPVRIRDLVRSESSLWQPQDDTPVEIAEYNQAASHHEHLIEKYCTVLGTSMAGVVCYEDRLALNYLLSRADVLPNQVGCLGLSGGGNRSAMLLATHDRIQAAVIVGMMSTYAGLLDHNIISHTWMFFPPGLARFGDWPDLAASRTPMPLMVQYDLDDDLFTVAGMRAANERIATHYRQAGFPEMYTSQFFAGPHKFDLEMQSAAFQWLKDNLVA